MADWQAKCEMREKQIAAKDATITALRDRVAEVERERDEARKELDERLEDLGRVIMACPMSPETRTSPAHLGVRVMRRRLDTAEARATAAEAAIARLRDEVMDVLEFYADPFAYVTTHGLDEATPDFYDELDTGSRAETALRALKDTHHETR